MGKFGGNNVWQIDSYKLFSKEKFGKWLSAKKLLLCRASLCFMCYDKIINLCVLSYFYPVGVSNDKQQYLTIF